MLARIRSTVRGNSSRGIATRRLGLWIESRPGYTLLEVLLASAIGVLLMGALYVAMDVQLRHAQAGRELIEQGTLVRALLARVASDVNCSIGPVAPVISSSSGSPASAASAGAGAGGAASGAAGTTANSGNASGGAAAAAPAVATANNVAQINLGVQGDNGRLTIVVSKWPRELDLSPNAAGEVQPAVSDLRRITYWLAGGSGDSPLGLARQEVKYVTSSDAMTAIPPDVPNEDSYVIAEEVKSLNFRYYDGTSYQDTWDGTQPGADGKTPQGPPLAIEITMKIAVPGAGPDGQPKLKTYRHVVPILTANGATQATTTNPTTP